MHMMCIQGIASQVLQDYVWSFNCRCAPLGAYLPSKDFSKQSWCLLCLEYTEHGIKFKQFSGYIYSFSSFYSSHIDSDVDDQQRLQVMWQLKLWI